MRKAKMFAKFLQDHMYISAHKVNLEKEYYNSMKIGKVKVKE